MLVYRLALHEPGEGISVSVPGMPGCWAQGAKVLWLRIGNCTTAHIEELLRAYTTAIADFVNNPGAGVMVLA